MSLFASFAAPEGKRVKRFGAAGAGRVACAARAGQTRAMRSDGRERDLVGDWLGCR